MGVFYGFSHQRTITSSQKAEHAKHEYTKKQSLIDQAKAEYAKTKPAPPAASKDDGTWIICTAGSASRQFCALDALHCPEYAYADLSTVVADANDPKFDLEKFLTKLSKENP